MPSFLDALSYEFLRNAVLAGVLASVLCGVIGTFVVVKKLAFISDGISHAAFGGMGLCFFFGIDPLLGAIPVALACAFALGAVDRETIRSYDALIGVLWAVGMAVGVVFVYKTPGYAPNLMTYLFGNILLVTRRDLLRHPDAGGLGARHAGPLLQGDRGGGLRRGVRAGAGAAGAAPDGAAARHDRPLGGDPDPGGGDHPGGGAADHPLGDQPDALEGSAQRLAGLGRDRRRHHPRRARSSPSSTTSPRGRRSSCSGRCC